MYSFETKNIIISNMNDVEFYDRQSLLMENETIL